jgi:hypothetical protein
MDSIMPSIKKLAHWCAIQLLGVMPGLYSLARFLKQVSIIGSLRHYTTSWRAYRRAQASDPSFPLRWANAYPRLYDFYEPAGQIPRHYFFQDIWAATRVFRSHVLVHHDIGSRMDGFIAHCLVFAKVVMFDIRPLQVSASNLLFCQAQAERMDNVETGSIVSLSCLHALEHFGLGRYGDAVNPTAYRTAAFEMKRILAPAGNLYVAVPIGHERLEFNAHRVFDPATILKLFDELELVEFSVVGDDDQLYENADWREFRTSHYACGLFWFRKPAAEVEVAARTAVT